MRIRRLPLNFPLPFDIHLAGDNDKNNKFILQHKWVRSCWTERRKVIIMPVFVCKQCRKGVGGAQVTLRS
jgi:hypothetical protein